MSIYYPDIAIKGIGSAVTAPELIFIFGEKDTAVRAERIKADSLDNFQRIKIIIWNPGREGIGGRVINRCAVTRFRTVEPDIYPRIGSG